MQRLCKNENCEYISTHKCESCYDSLCIDHIFQYKKYYDDQTITYTKCD